MVVNSVKEFFNRQVLVWFLVSLHFFYLVTTFDHFLQTVLGIFWTWNTYDTADVMLSIAMLLLIEQVMLLAKILLADYHQRHTLVFNIPYLLMPLLVPPISPEMEKFLDGVTVSLVSLYSLQIKWRLIFSSGSPMAPGSLITTLWGSWRSVLGVIIIFLAAFFVLMSLLAPDDIKFCKNVLWFFWYKNHFLVSFT